MVKFKKIENGKYKFSGIDSWTGKEMSGTIIDQPYDKKLNQRWEVRFDGSNIAEEMFSTLKDAKNWLKK